MTYLVGWNMPGYLPEMEPHEVETVQEGVDIIMEELNSLYDLVEDDKKRKYLGQTIGWISRQQDIFWIDCLGYSYWITPKVGEEPPIYFKLDVE